MPILENELLDIYHAYYTIKGMGMGSDIQVMRHINEILLSKYNFDKQAVKFFFIMRNEIKINKLKTIKF